MKITERLLEDHKTFRKIMSEIEVIGAARPKDGPVDRRLIRLVELLVDHLIIHTWGEETFYYPAIQAVLRKDPHPLISKQYLMSLSDQHQKIDELVFRLEKEIKTSNGPENWGVLYASFAGQLMAHIRKEEEELFPRSESLLGETRLEQLSLTFERNRSKAPKVNPHLRFAAQ